MNVAMEEADTPTSALTQSAWGRLVILSGTQQGAIASVPVGANLSIGRSLDNDIVLRDSSIESAHAALMAVDDTILLQCLGASLIVDGEPMCAGDSKALNGISMMQLGNVALSVERYSADAGIGPAEVDAALMSKSELFTPRVDDLPMPVSPQDQTEPQAEQQPQAGDESQAELQEDTGKSRSRKPGMVSLLVLLAGALVVWQSGLFRAPPVEPVSLQEMLAVSPFAASLSVEQQGNSATVSGFLDTTQQSMELEQWLDQSGLSINNEVLIGELLGDKVFDVFRVNGIPADVEVAPGGHVTVATREADVERLDTVNERVISDVPGVASLSIDNTPPPVVEKPVAVAIDPGKRVAMVISDEPAHVLTEDRSRYFVGSVLPTGHRIESIDDGVVSLVKNGNSTKLEF